VPIKEVAHRCGFHNKNIYFSNAFYRQHSLWPTAYRQCSRNRGGSV
jgi:transcriptional regulator GlxA family with amidase domain